MKKVYIFFLLLVIILVIAASIIWFLPASKNTVVNKAGTKNSQELSFVPLEKQAMPPFIKNVYPASDMKVDFHYEGDFTPQNDWGFIPLEYYTPPASSEKFLSVSKAKDRQDFLYRAGGYLPIFQSEGGHSYQGTPIYMTNPDDKYSLSYLGFKINDLSLISELKVELGIDYFAVPESGNTGAFKDNHFSLASLLGIDVVNACGPGVYVRKVGDSNLVFVQASDGIAWYKLEKPIALYNLDLNYCDDPPGTIPSYCNFWADDPPDCQKWCEYTASITSLVNGNLRMHVYYKPNDKEGLLRFQLANFIVSDPQGAYYQATMGQDFNHYYKAYLH